MKHRIRREEGSHGGANALKIQQSGRLKQATIKESARQQGLRDDQLLKLLNEAIAIIEATLASTEGDRSPHGLKGIKRNAGLEVVADDDVLQ